MKPIREGSVGTRDFMRLVIHGRRGVFQSEDAVVGLGMVSNSGGGGGGEGGKGGEVVGRNGGVAGERVGLVELPDNAKVVLCAAYLASYNISRMDGVYFSRVSGRKRRRRGGTVVGGRAKNRKVCFDVWSTIP